VGCHSQNHVRLTGLTPSELHAEVVESRGQLGAQLQDTSAIAHFCYPYGACDAAATEAVRAAGYLSATTTVRGRLDTARPHDLLLIPRVLMSRSSTWLHLLLKCFTSYEDRRGQPTNTL
jgi:peptidoglycan/xylan/chitin deacetylase (PgdA/CDA1 family)